MTKQEKHYHFEIKDLIIKNRSVSIVLHIKFMDSIIRAFPFTKYVLMNSNFRQIQWTIGTILVSIKLVE